MKKTIILLIALTILALSSCHDPFHSCIRGNGNVISEIRNPDSFYKIESEGDYNVFITQDTIDEVRVSAEENIMQYISTRSNGNKLTIKTPGSRCINNSEPINIYIKTTNISEVRLDGSGFINIENVNTNYLKLDISGSGDINGSIDVSELESKISGSGEIMLDGFCNESFYDISGSGKIRSYNLEQNKCFADISGSGNMYVFVNDLLDVRITGSGNCYYTGNPTVNLSITGSGSVINSN
jgi:hypothetical protein